MITGSRILQPAGGREREQGHMKEKMKRDLVDPWICGWRKGGKIKVRAQ